MSIRWVIKQKSFLELNRLLNRLTIPKHLIIDRDLVNKYKPLFCQIEQYADKNKNIKRQNYDHMIDAMQYVFYNRRRTEDDLMKEDEENLRKRFASLQTLVIRYKKGD